MTTGASTSTYAARSQRGLSPDLARKLDRLRAVSTKRQRIARIREALQNVVDSLERDWTARKRASCGGDAEPSWLLREAAGAAVDFEVLIAEDLK